MARRRTKTELMTPEVEALVERSIALHREINGLSATLRVDSAAYNQLDHMRDALNTFTCAITGKGTPPWFAHGALSGEKS